MLLNRFFVGLLESGVCTIPERQGGGWGILISGAIALQRLDRSCSVEVAVIQLRRAGCGDFGRLPSRPEVLQPLRGNF